MNDVVITGIGAVSSIGMSAAETWDGLKQGKSGAGPITSFDPQELEYNYRSQIGCEVRLDPTDYDCVDERQMGRYCQIGMIAAQEAMEDAGFGVDPEWDDPTKTGVSFGSCIGGLDVIEQATLNIHNSGRIPPRLSLKFLANMPAGYMSIAFNAQGQNRSAATACAAGTHAIGAAADDIRLGRADVMITGATDTGVCQTAVSGFDVLRALSTRNDDPERAIRPFDVDRDGFLLGDGAGALILESAEHAAQRGAEILATVEGTGRSADAEHPVRPAKDASGMTASVENALADANCDPGAVDHVSAHGTATPRGDEHEALCLNKTFDDIPPVTSIKSMLGHTLGAAGAIEAVVATQTINENVIPPTINYQMPDPDCDIPVVSEPLETEVDTVVSNSAGFGGTNGTLVLGAHD